MFILDTDHISLFQRNHPAVVAKILKTSADKLATTIITAEEQLRGRLNRVRKARNDEEIVRAYNNLSATLLYFNSITVIVFDEKPQAIFRKLRKQKIRVGTQDLRIAAIGLANDATIVTRNRKDFSYPLYILW
ncbi:type II toxin-antitoxin system VapC family toxin [Desulfobacterales bacterium HSG16]|nr:type II toxin-antitoxin system VapC family toxin [Desulfobacterales bacterium HSG16]